MRILYLQVSKLMKCGADVLQSVKIADHGDPGTVADFAHAAFKLVHIIIMQNQGLIKFGKVLL